MKWTDHNGLTRGTNDMWRPKSTKSLWIKEKDEPNKEIPVDSDDCSSGGRIPHTDND